MGIQEHYQKVIEMTGSQGLLHFSFSNFLRAA